MQEAIHTEEHKGYTIKIFHDDTADNPREMFDGMATMACCHSRYNLGDEQWSAEDFEDFIKKEDILYLPLYLYDHSGLTINTTGFSCPWDSGQVGIIFIYKSKVLKEFGRKKMSKKLEQQAFNILKGEVQEYDDYLRGNVYGYAIEDANGEYYDSCWGFFGNYEDYMLGECRAIIDSKIERERARKEMLDYALENTLFEYVSSLR